MFPRLADRPDSETRDTPETHRDTAQTRRVENETRESLENTCREERTGGTKDAGDRMSTTIGENETWIDVIETRRDSYETGRQGETERQKTETRKT